MGKALYREYRPRTLADVAGQPHITAALERALKTGVVSHAYLFTGPRGVGKTSVARIMAHQVNGLPYDESAANHLDIIEIDAASNRGIEDVRELRDKVAIAPTTAKYKVYIIDEVHMLTTPAFNALLKTLEEPPEHAIFILATTEAHKVPETIISRTQHYAFRPISQQSIIDHLRHIAGTEHIDIDDEALSVLASHGGGSFRDSIGLLDQVQHSGDTITADDVRNILGIAPERAIRSILGAVANADAKTLYESLSATLEQGITPASLAAQLSDAIRSDLRNNSSVLPAPQALRIIEKLIEVAPSPNPLITLEVLLLGEVFAVNAPVVTNPVAPAAIPRLPVRKIPPETKSTADVVRETPQAKTETPETKNSDKSAPVAPKVQHDEEHEQRPVQAADQAAIDAFANVWPEVLLIIKQSHYTLYGVLRMANATLNTDALTLCFRFKLHKKKVDDPKNKDIISDAITKVTGSTYAIECTVDETIQETPTPAPATPAPIPQTTATPDSGSISAISNIFGGAELLES